LIARMNGGIGQLLRDNKSGRKKTTQGICHRKREGFLTDAIRQIRGESVPEKKGGEKVTRQVDNGAKIL